MTATDEDELAARIRKAEEENAEVKIENLFLGAGGNSFHDYQEHKMLPGDGLVSIPQGVSAHG